MSTETFKVYIYIWEKSENLASPLFYQKVQILNCGLFDFLSWPLPPLLDFFQKGGHFLTWRLPLLVVLFLDTYSTLPWVFLNFSLKFLWHFLDTTLYKTHSFTHLLTLLFLSISTLSYHFLCSFSLLNPISTPSQHILPHVSTLSEHFPNFSPTLFQLYPTVSLQFI